MAEIGITRMEARKDTICGKLTGGRMSEDCGVGGRRARKRVEVRERETQEGRQLPKGKERLPAVNPQGPKANKCRAHSRN